MAPVLYVNIIRRVISLTHRSRKILYLITWRVFFSCISTLLIPYSHGSFPIWVKGITGRRMAADAPCCFASRRRGTSKGTVTFPYSSASILAIVYHQKDTSFNESSCSHASNDQYSLMLYYKKMIIVLRRWGGNIIETKRRKQPVSKVIQASSMLLSRPYKCGTNGLWSDCNGIHGCHGSSHWDY